MHGQLAILQWKKNAAVKKEEFLHSAVFSDFVGTAMGLLPYHVRLSGKQANSVLTRVMRQPTH